jgi:hypothetical protein
LFDHAGPGTDPLSPDNYLILTAGPLIGTLWPTSARLHVTFKSPLTGVYGYANSGGFFAAEMRHAGYDAIVVTGQAEQPVMLRVSDDTITIEPASDLWGKSTGEGHDALLGPNPTAAAGRVACIGGFDSGPEYRTPENIALSVRVGAELGADFIKTPYAPGFEKVANTCYVPGVILGGAKRGSERAMLAARASPSCTRMRRWTRQWVFWKERRN